MSHAGAGSFVMAKKKGWRVCPILTRVVITPYLLMRFREKFRLCMENFMVLSLFVRWILVQYFSRASAVIRSLMLRVCVVGFNFISSKWDAILSTFSLPGVRTREETRNNEMSLLDVEKSTWIGRTNSLYRVRIIESPIIATESAFEEEAIFRVSSWKIRFVNVLSA